MPLRGEFNQQEDMLVLVERIAVAFEKIAEVSGNINIYHANDLEEEWRSLHVLEHEAWDEHDDMMKRIEVE